MFLCTAESKLPPPRMPFLAPVLRHSLCVGNGKDIGKDEPAFGWELEPFAAFGSVSGNASSGKIQDRLYAEHMRQAMRPGMLILCGGAYMAAVCVLSEVPLTTHHAQSPVLRTNLPAGFRACPSSGLTPLHGAAVGAYLGLPP